MREGMGVVGWLRVFCGLIDATGLLTSNHFNRTIFTLKLIPKHSFTLNPFKPFNNQPKTNADEVFHSANTDNRFGVLKPGFTQRYSKYHSDSAYPEIQAN